MRLSALVFLAWLVSAPAIGASAAADNAHRGGPSGAFTPVQPLHSTPAARTPTPELRIGQGRFFSYALPAGWRVGEDGQFALSLVAPDNQAFTVMVGNAGVMPGHSPAQFVYEKLSALRPQRLQLGQPRQAAPVAGFQQAYAFDVALIVGGSQRQGLAVCHVAPYYGGAVMAMTAAITDVKQWPGYATWLPAVAAQISASNGAAFGVRGLMQQNLRNSREFGEAASRYREWSQHNWQQVTDERNASRDRQAFHNRENLGGVQTYTDPRDTGRPIELGSQYKHYWIDRQGHIVGTNDPAADPNAGSTGDWVRMPRRGP